MNYFDHPYVSNSDLSALAVELSGQDAMEYADALRFGTLVHALILEPEKVDLIRRTVEQHQYTKEEMTTAKKMRDAFMKDPFCYNLWSVTEKEVEMYNENTPFIYDGISFTLNTRRKYDMWNHMACWGSDIKSTTATTEAGFLSAVSRFDYDRARVFYSKGPGSNQDVIIGISKVAPYRVFKVFMRHGDHLWQTGESKMNELAYKYWALK